MNDGELDMRFDGTKGLSAKEFLNNIDEFKLGKIIKKFGEEKNYKNIAKNIIKYSKEGNMNTTSQLKDAIMETTNPKYINKTLSRVFQSIRMRVNDEIENLNIFLLNSIRYLKSGGRLVIITFHSIEDSIVKHFFKDNANSCVCPPQFPLCVCEKKARLKIIKNKGILPSVDEINSNPRSRSARLRIAECL